MRRAEKTFKKRSRKRMGEVEILARQHVWLRLRSTAQCCFPSGRRRYLGRAGLSPQATAVLGILVRGTSGIRIQSCFRAQTTAEVRSYTPTFAKISVT